MLMRLIQCLTLAAVTLSWVDGLLAKTTVADALRLEPVQSGVEYDRPKPEDIPKCRLTAAGGGTMWVVHGPGGEVMRRFVDTNRDKSVDQWCYYLDGIEVYRDIDADYNEKADQYRWLGTAGIRWGIDKDEDGHIDDWKMISAEEVTAELISAVRDKDSRRFQRVLLGPNEVLSLGLSQEKAAQLQNKVQEAAARFRTASRRQRIIGLKARWLHFAGTRPGILPAGTDGSSRDIMIYENVIAMFENDGNHGQLNIGSLVRVGDTWRLIDLPADLDDGQASSRGGGFFFANHTATADTADAELPEEVASKELQELTVRLDQLEQQITQRSGSAGAPGALSELNDQRVLVLRKLASLSKTDEERRAWSRQLADTLSGAAQSGMYPNGLRVLQQLFQDVREDAELAPYVRFREISTQYALQLQESDADFAKVQQDWLQLLQRFVQDYSQSTDAPEAMMQLALAEEFAGNDQQASSWYQQVTRANAEELVKRKARGALLRLDSVGKPLRLRGPVAGVKGRSIDLAALRGRIVLVHYWATWCEPCKQDLHMLRELRSKYGKRGFECVGINLDNDQSTVAAFLRKNRLDWPQIHEGGGLDSRLAVDFGVTTLPTMLLVDSEGNVLNRNIHVTELELELRKRLK